MNTYTVIAVYLDNNQGYADTFSAQSATHAKEMLDDAGLRVIAVLEGEPEICLLADAED